MDIPLFQFESETASFPVSGLAAHLPGVPEIPAAGVLAAVGAAKPTG